MMYTLFVPLSGRIKCWRRLSHFLNFQLKNNDCFVLFLDSSNNFYFRSKIENWIKKNNYGKKVEIITRVFSQTKNLADKLRPPVFAEVNLIMCKIYEMVKQYLRGDFIFIVEDDIIPPKDAFFRLKESLSDDAASISGAYKMKNDYYWVAWRDFDNGCIKEKGIGVEEIKGNGFGCLLMRTEDYLLSEINWTKKNNTSWPWGYDMEFFSKQKKKVLINWDVVCDHLNELKLKDFLLC